MPQTSFFGEKQMRKLSLAFALVIGVSGLVQASDFTDAVSKNTNQTNPEQRVSPYTNQDLGKPSNGNPYTNEDLVNGRRTPDIVSTVTDEDGNDVLLEDGSKAIGYAYVN